MSDLEDSCCRAAQYHFALLGVQAEFLDDLHGLLVAHFEAIVAAEHNSIATYLGDDVFHERLRMGDHVISETA
jgi:hypothetical protein